MLASRKYTASGLSGFAGAFSSMLSFVPSLPRFSSGENEAEASDDAGGCAAPGTGSKLVAGGAAKEGSMVSHFLSLAGDIIEEADGGELKRCAHSIHVHVRYGSDAFACRALFFRKVMLLHQAQDCMLSRSCVPHPTHHCPGAFKREDISIRNSDGLGLSSCSRVLLLT